MKSPRSSVASLASLALLALAACSDGSSKPEAAAKEPPTSVTTATTAPTAAASGAAAPTAEPTAVAEAAPTASASAEPSAATAAGTAAPLAAATNGAKTTATPTATAATTAAPTAPAGPVAGKPWQVSTSVQADAGYKCNPEYPHKFVTNGGANVTYPDPKPRGQCAGKGVSVTIPFVPSAAGPGTVVGTFSYGICDEGKTSCLMKKQEVTLPFTAAAN